MYKWEQSVIHGMAAFAFVVVFYILGVINSSYDPKYTLKEAIVFGIVFGFIVFVISRMLPGGDPKP